MPQDVPPTHPLQILVVAHTHWDREWYLPAGRFRQRLVALVDELLAEPGSSAEPFLLDGQSVVLDDYLAVRPENRAVLGERLRDGSIEAGPWYVLADELIPSGEALVRNLLAGRATLDAFGAEPPPVLYCPDSFGHPAALPLLADGFGCPLMVLWRGYGGPAWPAGDVFRWRAADATVALVYHLSPDGYELGGSLPEDAAGAEARWAALRDVLAARATLGVALLPNGADHHARQPRLDRAVAALARAASSDALVRRASLAAFARAVVARARDASLPEIGGEGGEGVELRNSYGYTWTLQGTFGARAQLKRRNAQAERLLVRDMEPWLALAALHARGHDRAALARAAWKTLLLCHPHDTLCGCSTDEVARAMVARLDDAVAQGTGLRDDAILDVVGHDPVRARRDPASWRPVVVVRNAAARPRSGIAELEVLRFREHVRVGPGSAPPRAGALPRSSSAPDLEEPRLALRGGGVQCQRLEHDVKHDRVESPLSYPHDDLVDCDRVVAWLPAIAGYGTTALTIDDSAVGDSSTSAVAAPPAPVRAGETWLDNGLLRVRVAESGDVSLEAAEVGVVHRSLIAFEDTGDAGDLYTHSPRPPLVEHAAFAGARVVHRGPLRGELHAVWQLEVPARASRDGRSAPTRRLELGIALTLDAGARFLRARVWGDNQCADHRLRVLFRTGVANADVRADAAFGSVPRTKLQAAESTAELAPPTAPLARYVTLSGDRRGATLYSDGLAEYEATAAGDVAVTLLRAVGELSRNDLPERPGHAGWPVPTPEAQSLGAFEARFALLPHGGRDADERALIERTADDVLLPLTGSTLRSALSVPASTRGVELLSWTDTDAELDGALAFSCCKPSESGGWMVLRCLNLTDRAIAGRWRLGVPVSEARLARLDETPSTPLTVSGSEVSFEARPRAVVTVLVRGPSSAG